MTHDMRLQSGPFEKIQNGTKTIELRLWDEKRARISPGDTIIFRKAESDARIMCTVLRLYRYPSFEELYRHHDKCTLGYDASDIADPSDMLAYYSPDAIKRCGVVGIEIRKTEGVDETDKDSESPALADDAFPAAPADLVRDLFGFADAVCTPIPGHEGGRNLTFRCSCKEGRYILRISCLEDRSYDDYLAETEFVRYLSERRAPVASVLTSVSGNLVERTEHNGHRFYISLFAFAAGILISDNGYRYREGAPIEEYFYNTGKTLGIIHRLSKQYTAVHRRPDYFSRYNEDYIGSLIPDSFAELKRVIFERLAEFRSLPTGRDFYGLIHFDYSDGNYHIDMETGNITVFDFDNCLYGWYLFDLANLWTHGEGWCRGEPDAEKRAAYMTHYFDTVLSGYRSETEIPDTLLSKLSLFVDMVLIENIVDEFECCARVKEAVDPEDIEYAARCLTERIPFAGLADRYPYDPERKGDVSHNASRDENRFD